MSLSYITIPKEGTPALPGQYYSFETNEGWKLPLACAGEDKNGRRVFVHNSKKLKTPITYDETPHGTSFPMDTLGKVNNIYLIGGGTGYSSLRSVNQALKDKNVKIIYSAKTLDTLPFPMELKTLAKNPNHKISLTGTKDDQNHEPLLKGRVTKHLPKSFHKDDLIYICGPHGLTKAVVDEVQKRGLSKDRIILSLPMAEKDDGPVIRLGGNEEKIEAFMEKWSRWG